MCRNLLPAIAIKQKNKPAYQSNKSDLTRYTNRNFEKSDSSNRTLKIIWIKPHINKINKTRYRCLHDYSGTWNAIPAWLIMQRNCCSATAAHTARLNLNRTFNELMHEFPHHGIYSKHFILKCNHWIIKDSIFMICFAFKCWTL